MNLPKQSRPVIRDVTRAPITAQIEGAQPWIGGHRNPLLTQCLQGCAGYQFCENACYAVYG
jgi:hypothetical protein